MIFRSLVGVAIGQSGGGEFNKEEVFIMRFIIIAILGFVCAGMPVFALANPALLPQHPGYPSRGEFANDTGRKNLTYSQSMEEAARSGDITMGTVPIDPKHTAILEPQAVAPSKQAVGQPQREGVLIPKK